MHLWYSSSSVERFGFDLSALAYPCTKIGAIRQAYKSFLATSTCPINLLVETLCSFHCYWSSCCSKGKSISWLMSSFEILVSCFTKSCLSMVFLSRKFWLYTSLSFSNFTFSSCSLRMMYWRSSMFATSNSKFCLWPVPVYWRPNREGTFLGASISSIWF